MNTWKQMCIFCLKFQGKKSVTFLSMIFSVPDVELFLSLYSHIKGLQISV